MKQIKYKSGIIILFNIILFIAMYVGIALLRYKTFINTGIGAGISGNAIDNISDINGDEFASNPPDEFEDVNLFIDEITDGQYYSFGESSVEFCYDKSLKGLEEFSDGGSYFYSALYITDKFPKVYKWEMFEGTMFDDEEYKHISEKYIPIVVGYNYRKSYSVGDVIDDTYIIKGILEKNQFYLNPKWQGKVYYTDNIIIMPMVYSLEEWGGDIVNQLHILKSDKEIEQEIQEEIKRFNMPLIEFRSMNEQIGYIKKDVANYVRYYGCSMIIILCVSCISYISMLVLLVDIKRKEYAIKIMCGASKVNIFIEMAGPIFGAILFANIISAIILGQIRLLGYLVIFSIVLAFVILIAPSVKLFRMTLAESINK